MGLSNNVVTGSAAFGRVNSYVTMAACCIIGLCCMLFGIAPLVVPTNSGKPDESKTNKVIVAVLACVCGLSWSVCGIIWVTMVAQNKGLAAVSGAAALGSAFAH